MARRMWCSGACADSISVSLVLAQGPCYDFTQQLYLDMRGNTTLFNCMKDKMATPLPQCQSMMIAFGMCAPPMGTGGGGGGWMRRGAHNVPCTPMTPAAVPLTKEMYDTMMKNTFKGMTEYRCDPDGEIKDEDKEK